MRILGKVEGDEDPESARIRHLGALPTHNQRDGDIVTIEIQGQADVAYICLDGAWKKITVTGTPIDAGTF